MKTDAGRSAVLIGAGNVAAHLAPALQEAGFTISQVFSAQGKSAAALAKKTGAKAVRQLSALQPEATLYLIAVKDDAIGSLAKKLKIKKGLVVHTSGSVALDVLKPAGQPHGVLYPLQSLSKKRALDMQQVPLCIEASDKKTLKALKEIAQQLSQHVYPLDSKQRRAAHLAAIFANNFTNHFYAIAAELLSENKLPFDLLRPLILETAMKALDMPPAEAQTGPALRHDKQVMKRHLELLKKHPRWAELYALASKDIADTH